MNLGEAKFAEIEAEATAGESKGFQEFEPSNKEQHI